MFDRLRRNEIESYTLFNLKQRKQKKRGKKKQIENSNKHGRC